MCKAPILSLLPAVASGASYTSTLIGTSWRVRLDIGLERGSWMPKNIKGWGGSGARVVVSALVDFEAELANEAEELVGPRSQTRVLNARGGGKIVTFDGEQAVDFTSGGWCVQRPLGAQAGSDEGLLRFWLDCPSGCARGDVVVPQGERIFFSTGVWDDAQGVRQLCEKKAMTEGRLRGGEAGDSAGKDEDRSSSGFALSLPGAAFRRQVAQQEALTALRSRRAYYESWAGLEEGWEAIPAKQGSLSLKRQSGIGLLGRAIGTEYHILGTFGAERVLRSRPS